MAELTIFNLIITLFTMLIVGTCFNRYDFRTYCSIFLILMFYDWLFAEISVDEYLKINQYSQLVEIDEEMKDGKITYIEYERIKARARDVIKNY